MTQEATFRLKCVLCGKTETRLALECVEQPFCTQPQCCGPMLLVAVKIKEVRERSRKRKGA